MKKIFCLLGISFLMLTSCSEDPVPTPILDNDVFLKKTIEMDIDSVFVTTNYNYDLNKLVSVLSDDPLEMDVFVTYTGDLISKMEYRRNDSIKYTTHYEYDFDDKLISFLKLTPVDSLAYRENYTYNPGNGTISILSFTGDYETQTTPKGNGSISFLDGEVTSLSTSYSPTYSYTYDTKKYPLKNVLGLAKISFTDTQATGVLHNIITKYINGINPVTYAFTYDADFYPLTRIETQGGVTNFTIQYFYE